MRFGTNAASYLGKKILRIGVVQDVAERERAKRQLQKYRQRLRALASELALAEDKERRRIATELHDHVGQSLALARVQLATAAKATSDVQLLGTLDGISQSLLRASREIRQLVFDLSCPALDEIGLTAAISEWLEAQVRPRYGLETEVIDNRDDGCRKTLRPDVRALLFRNLRELLANVIKHAEANKVRVCLEHSEGNMEVTVADDGVGFDFDEISSLARNRGSFGLFSVQERMTDLGGSLNVESKPGKGCKAILTVPDRNSGAQGRG